MTAAGGGAMLDLQATGYKPKVPVATLVEWFEDSEQTTETSRRTSEKVRDYVDNKQLTADELKELAGRGQPDVIINRMKTKVKYLVGYEVANRTDPRGLPRTKQDENAADACTDALRYVRDSSDLQMRFSQVWENMVIEGTGGIEVRFVPNGEGGGEFEFLQWHWDRIFYDPHSREHDFSDARYLGGIVWMDYEDAIAKWPDAEDVLAKTVSDDRTRTYADRPDWKAWCAGGTRKRVRIVQIWHRVDRTWHWCIFTKGGHLEGGESQYRDEDNKSLCPVIFQSAYVDRENNRYGEMLTSIGPQDELNKRRSKGLHLIMHDRSIGEEGAIGDVDAMRSEKAKPDGHIVVTPGMRFEPWNNQAQIEGNLQLMQEAKNELDLQGPNAALMGKQGDLASGRAILASQQGGQVELTMLMDRHRHFRLRVYRLVWAMIRMYWTGETWVRVTDNEDNLKFVGLNRPVTFAEEYIRQAEKAGQNIEELKANLAQQAQTDPMIAQQLQSVVRMENVPAEMSMDIILDEAPDTANLQQEQFQIMAELAKSGQVQFTPRQWIKMSAMKNKAEMLKEFEDASKTDPAKEAQAKAAQLANQATLEKMEAEIAKLKAQVGQIRADTFSTLVDADMKRGGYGVLQLPEIIPANNSGQTQERPMPPSAMPQGQALQSPPMRPRVFDYG